MKKNSKTSLLRVENLEMHFPILGGVLRRQIARVHAVDDISLDVDPVKPWGWSANPVAAKPPRAELFSSCTSQPPVESGSMGKSAGHAARRLRSVRRNLQMIFQDPFESLNARHTVGDILAEPFMIHRIGTNRERQESAKHLLDRVGLPRDAA